MQKTYRALGLMSGSSLDGLDIACCVFTINSSAVEIPLKVASWKLEAAATIPYSSDWQLRLKNLPEESALAFAKTHVDFGHYLGKLVNTFLQKHDLKPDLIASHGHTVFHYPDQHFTTQIGDGAALVAATGLTVVDNFRNLDVALNGQGAPLAPLADLVLLRGYDFYLNLGGIANISADTKNGFVAFDIGGANQVLNTLVAPLGLEYDHGGNLAAKGTLQPTLLEKVNELLYFHEPYPKSLGNQWVRTNLQEIYNLFDFSLEDKLHTACIQLAQQTAKSIQQIIKKEGLKKDRYQLLATGGGAFNHFLIKCIEEEANKVCPLEVKIPEEQIISFKEAILMALMGVMRMENQPNCLSSVTGANRAVIGGAVHQGG